MTAKELAFQREEILADWNAAVLAFRILALTPEDLQPRDSFRREIETSKRVIRFGLASPLWTAYGGPR